MNLTETPPDPQAVLADLKDFQRRTVDHVFRRLYTDPDPTNRFLVADEVGLGKTLVARGVISLAVEHLWEQTERVDIIYICSNAAIARQNIKRLGIGEQAQFSRADRLTLLPVGVHDLKHSRLNLVSLTPKTSFEHRSATGIASERAVLHEILKDAWGWGGRERWQRNLLCCGASRRRIDSEISWIRSGPLDEELCESFIAALEAEDDAATARGEATLRLRFEGLSDTFRRPLQSTPDAERRERDDVVSKLREILARSCVSALEPDLIILDEFQRFRRLLRRDNDAGEMALRLFDYEGPEELPAKTLLLSATPFVPYAQSADGDPTVGLEDFAETTTFLLSEPRAQAELHDRMTSFRSHLIHFSGLDDPCLRADKAAIETTLQRVMSRTERLASSADRNGMLREIPPCDYTLYSTDALAYLGVQRIARAVGHGDTLEFWKSAPYLPNLMDSHGGYQLKRDLEATLEAGGENARELEAALESCEETLLDRDNLRGYRAIDPGNPRLRSLQEELWQADAWQMLWLAPCLPYYGLGGPFGTEAGSRLTKRLVFSSWQVVPKAISLLLSYAAERQMTLSRQRRARNTERARKTRAGLLRLTLAGDEPQGMQTLALMYPSFALAETLDPATLAAEHGAPLSGDEARELAEERLAGSVAEVIGDAAELPGPEDDRWYWATPFLLDAALDRDAARAWLASNSVRWLRAGSAGNVSTDPWRTHLEEADRAIAGDLARPLGRPPADLLEVIARQALAAPGTSSLRALARLDGGLLFRDPELRTSGMSVGWGFRTLFNLPEVTSMIRGYGWQGAYSRQVLRYCVDGCLQSVLDEYVHLLREHLGHIGQDLSQEEVNEVAGVMHDVIGLRTTQGAADFFERGPEGHVAERERIRARFALRFGQQRTDEGADAIRSDLVRDAFNSPFWPFVLASTSVGQEGLDFHLYCHRIVHWNLPSNPVDLEQREGRIHRYKGHAVRRNLAARHGDQVMAGSERDPWEDLFARGAADRPEDETELWPYWIYAPDGEAAAMIERQVMAFALSRDHERLDRLKRELALYRSVIGQPRQDDLVGLLAEKLPEDEWEQAAQELRIELAPPKAPKTPA